MRPTCGFKNASCGSPAASVVSENLELEAVLITNEVGTRACNAMRASVPPASSQYRSLRICYRLGTPAL